MTLNQLRYLVALADHLHFGRAAKACGVEQPTLSAQIKRLEEHLKADLVVRSRTEIQMTRTGADLVERARRVIDESNGILAAARRGGAALVGERRLGVMPTLCSAILPWTAPVVRKNFPELALTFIEKTTRQLVEDLHMRRLDWAMVSGPVSIKGFESINLFDEALVLAVPNAHPAAERTRFRQDALAQERLLLLAEGHCLRDQAAALCAAHSAVLGCAEASATNLETLRSLVATNQGVALIPALSAQSVSGVSYLPLSPGADRKIVLIFRDNGPQRDEAEALAGCIKEAHAARV